MSGDEELPRQGLVQGKVAQPRRPQEAAGQAARVIRGKGLVAEHGQSKGPRHRGVSSLRSSLGARSGSLSSAERQDAWRAQGWKHGTRICSQHIAFVKNALKATAQLGQGKVRLRDEEQKLRLSLQHHILQR